MPDITIGIQHMNSWSGSLIDPVSNLYNRRIYLFTGITDDVVGVPPMDKHREQLSVFADPEKLTYVLCGGASHTFPTDSNAPGNSPCSQTASPYISNCGYDGAGEVLKWMYGDLAARNDDTLTGHVLDFDQSGSFVAEAMASTGYMYVPKACQDGHLCKLHVALHGCRQSAGFIGTTFVNNTGYNKWAGKSSLCLKQQGKLISF